MQSFMIIYFICLPNWQLCFFLRICITTTVLKLWAKIETLEGGFNSFYESFSVIFTCFLTRFKTFPPAFIWRENIVWLQHWLSNTNTSISGEQKTNQLSAMSLKNHCSEVCINIFFLSFEHNWTFHMDEYVTCILKNDLQLAAGL